MSDALAAPPRWRALRARLRDGLQRRGDRVYRREADQQAFADLVRDVCPGTASQPEVQRKAAFLEAFAGRFPVHLTADELIVGTQAFSGWESRLTAAEREACAFHGNPGHLIVDYGRVLREGVAGLRAAVDRMPGNPQATGDNREACGRTVAALSIFIRRHAAAARQQADDTADVARARELTAVAAHCAHLADQPPRGFWEALQLVWFTQIFLHVESAASAISFGRFDQYLWPFLEMDLARGRLDWATADELLACFWLKCCEGNESQNLTVGGVTAAGASAENPLSRRCLQVARELAVWQPSVSCRIGPLTTDEFWAAALDLCAAGFGMPSFFNDPVVSRALQAAGIPAERARDWGVVGCYEATPQGDTRGWTVAAGFSLPDALREFLETDAATAAPTFAALAAGFADFLRSAHDARLAAWEATWQWHRANSSSPFASVCLTGCLDSGLTVEEDGGRFNLFGVNILGLGTTVDSLCCLKALVFDERHLSLPAFRQQVRENFPAAALCHRCRRVGGRFGSDAPDSTRLAADLARTVADLVLSRRLPGGSQPYPGFFRFGADVLDDAPATPDGRRAGDRLSYGAGPGVFLENTSPTAILNSVAALPHDRCGCGNPLLLSLNHADVAGAAGRRHLRHLVETYFQQGGFHLHANVLDADQLRQAQAAPQEYAGLNVRISGFSARFVALPARWQDAIIERTAKGM